MVKNKLSLNLSTKLTSNVDSNLVHSYEETIKTLNSLQTNAVLLESYKKEGQRSKSVQQSKLDDTLKYLLRSGVTLENLDSLSVIHVAGTKGKGSTCAICESILRQHGLKTGFYSSPHLVAVRERIRINGKPLSEEQFSKYFWHVYNALNAAKINSDDLPPYFKFLTVMAFNVFLREKVDVAVVEVGIGGEYDCTNVLRKVPVIGITSLGLDHTKLLGRTIEEIAWQKGGILKPGSSAFTVEQPPAAMNVLQSRALERNCTLKVVPSIEAYDWGASQVTFESEVQNINSSLALQLSYAWLTQHGKGINGCNISSGILEKNYLEEALPFKITPQMLHGLRNCSWPGRMHTIHKGHVSFFLDGAHTLESIEVCSKWFLAQCNGDRTCKKFLVFNATGDRDITNLLSSLIHCEFDKAIFCPNLVHQNVAATSDQANFMIPSSRQSESCQKNRQIWERLVDEYEKQNDTFLETNQHEISSVINKSLFFPCVEEVVSYVENETKMSNSRIHVLVTGSLHLIGCILRILDPELTIPSHQFYIEHMVDVSL